MYHSLYQKKTIEYLFNKYKFGSKRKEQNDIDKLNLKGKIKNYKIICNDTITLEYEFNEFGFIILEFNPKEYYNNEYNSINLLKERTVYNTSDKKIRSEYFFYDKFNFLDKKNVENHTHYDRGYDEYYEYDNRGNTTAIIKQHLNSNDDIDTYKYNSKSQITDHYLFTKSSQNYIGRFKYKYKYFFILENFFSDENELLSSKKSILDLNNNPIQVEKYVKFMNSRSTTNYLYSYDKFKNWITRGKSLNGKKTVRETTLIEYFEN